jgi:WD40 repeat protein
MLLVVAIAAVFSGCDSGGNNHRSFRDLDGLSLDRFGGGKLAFHRRLSTDAEAWEGLVVVGGKDLVTRSGSNVSNPAISPDGEKVAFWTENRRGGYLFNSYDLQMLDLPSGETAEWEIELPGLLTSGSGYALWSKDGSALYIYPYAKFSYGLRESVRLYPADNPTSSYDEFELAGPYSSVSRLLVSAEDWLILGWDDEANANSVFIQDRMSGDTRRILQAQTVYQPAPSTVKKEYTYYAPAWSPDGRQIAVLGLEATLGGHVWSEGHTSILVLDAAFGEYSLTHTYELPREDKNQFWDSELYLSTAWSPDGNWIAFSEVTAASNGVGATSSHIFAYNLTTGELVQLTSASGAMDSEISWSLR